MAKNAVIKMIVEDQIIVENGQECSNQDDRRSSNYCKR